MMREFTYRKYELKCQSVLVSFIAGLFSKLLETEYVCMMYVCMRVLPY